MLFGSCLCTSFKIHKFGQTFCIFYSLFLIRGHKEFTCWSCTLWMYRPFRCLLHQMVLPVLIQHHSVETECTSSWGLVVLFSFLPLVYYLSCILVCTIHFNSLPAFLFFYFFILFTFLFFFGPSYSPSFSTSSVCVISMCSQVLVFLDLFFSHLCPVFSARLFLSPFVSQFRKL